MAVLKRSWTSRSAFITLPQSYYDNYLTPVLIPQIKEVVVGDIALLEPGEVVPCDGVFLDGHKVKCDESVIDGKLDTVKKIKFEKCMNHKQKVQERSKLGPETYEEPSDCFVVSGSKVLEGLGIYIVVAVGTKCVQGRRMMGMSVFSVWDMVLVRPHISYQHLVRMLSIHHLSWQ